MSCYFPWSPVGAGASRPLACGRCHGCRLEKARQWAVRCTHEASLHLENCFITLTFREAAWSLEYSLFQDFLKRLRFKFRPRKIGFFMSGEYGDVNSRAHFHALLFNLDFPDREYLRTTRAGSKLYRSAILEQLWPHGFSSIGTVNFESAGYVARYAMKKVLGDGSDISEILDPDTGEVYRRVKEFSRMSLRPAIGRNWIRRFTRDVYPQGTVVMNGIEGRAPRYYDKFFRAVDAGGYMELCNARAKYVPEVLAESTPERLEAREKVSVARLGLSKKSI